jgi:hypothetical protein
MSMGAMALAEALWFCPGTMAVCFSPLNCSDTTRAVCLNQSGLLPPAATSVGTVTELSARFELVGQRPAALGVADDGKVVGERAHDGLEPFEHGQEPHDEDRKTRRAHHLHEQLDGVGAAIRAQEVPDLIDVVRGLGIVGAVG